MSNYHTEFPVNVTRRRLYRSGGQDLLYAQKFNFKHQRGIGREPRSIVVDRDVAMLSSRQSRKRPD